MVKLLIILVILVVILVTLVYTSNTTSIQPVANTKRMSDFKPLVVSQLQAPSAVLVLGKLFCSPELERETLHSDKD